MQEQPRRFDGVGREHEDFACGYAFAAVPPLEADCGDVALGANFDPGGGSLSMEHRAVFLGAGQTGMQLALPQQARLPSRSTELRACGVARSSNSLPASARA